MVYLAQVECREMMRAFAKPGERVPIAGSAVGKILLARMKTRDVSKLLMRIGSEPKYSSHHCCLAADGERAVEGSRG